MAWMTREFGFDYQHGVEISLFVTVKTGLCSNPTSYPMGETAMDQY